MGFLDKLRNRSQISKGKAKQKAGRATGNRKMQTSGLGDRLRGGTKQVGEKLKDVNKDGSRGRRGNRPRGSRGSR
jgi:uncharacterized protein YjbJ (UPF0337 family)